MHGPVLGESRALPCLQCGYDLRGVPGNHLRCPDCGSRYARQDLHVRDAARPAQRRGVVAVSCCVIAGTLFGVWMRAMPPWLASAHYWDVGVPLLIVMSALVGMYSPRSALLGPAVLCGSHFVILFPLASWKGTYVWVAGIMLAGIVVATTIAACAGACFIKAATGRR